MSNKTYFITGGNRGIGFEIVKILSSNSRNIVIASARNPARSKELIELSKSNENIHVISLDVSSRDSIMKLDSQLSDVAKDGIDVFISNAGIAKPEAHEPILSTDWDLWIDHFTTNALGAIFTTKIVYPYLLKKETRQIIFISSIVGSLSNFLPLSNSAYGQSKAALNHSILTLAHELKPEKFTVIAAHPGVVSTDMAKGAAHNLQKNHPEAAASLKDMSITPEFSAESLVKLFEGLTIDQNGKFLSYDGTQIPY